MKKRIKLHQNDIANIVIRILENKMDEIDNVDNNITSEEINLDPSAQKILQNYNLEIRPDVTPVTPTKSPINILKDKNGRYYVINYDTGEIIGSK